MAESWWVVHGYGLCAIRDKDEWPYRLACGIDFMSSLDALTLTGAVKRLRFGGVFGRKETICPRCALAVPDRTAELRLAMMEAGHD